MDAKTKTKWEALKQETTELSSMINYCGRNGKITERKQYEKKYKAAHARMRRFAQAHGLAEEYRNWIS